MGMYRGGVRMDLHAYFFRKIIHFCTILIVLIHSDMHRVGGSGQEGPSADEALCTSLLIHTKLALCNFVTKLGFPVRLGCYAAHKRFNGI